MLSETKGALGGMLIGAGAFVRRGFLRVSHRASTIQQAAGGGGLRTAFAGVAVTSAAVAAAIVAPQAFSSNHPGTQSAISTPATEASNLAAPNLPLTAIPAVVTSSGDDSGGALSNVTGGSLPVVHGTRAIGSSSLALPAKSTGKTSGSGPSSSTPGTGGTNNGPLSNLPNTAAGVLAPLNPVLSPVLNTLGSVGSALSSTPVSGLASTLGLAQVINQLGLAPVTDSLGLTTPASSSSDSTASGTAAGTTTTTLPALLNNVTNTVGSTLKSLLGHS